MVKIVTAAAVCRQGKVLVARRAPGQAHQGKWEFPGGKLEPGEEERACLERELWEELGMRGRTGIHLADSPYDYGQGRILLRAYLFNWQEGGPELRVHDKLAWAGPEALSALDFTPADLPIARRVSAYLTQSKGEGEDCPGADAPLAQSDGETREARPACEGLREEKR